MPTEILTKLGTAKVWANTSDYSIGASNLARTDQIDLTSVAATEAREGTQGDFTATQAGEYRVIAGVEMNVAPTSAEVIDYYWAGTTNATAASGNPGGTVGVDGDYTGSAGDSLDDSLKQLRYLGSLVLTADASGVVQIQEIGTVTSAELGRYGMPVVDNSAATAAMANTATHAFIAFVPVIDEAQ
jgi:hypothetical protein